MITHCRIDEIKVGPRFRKRLGNVEALARSIEQVGLLHPIVIDQHFNLVAGRRRLEALKVLIAKGSEGWKEVPVRQVNLDDLLAAEHDENVLRLNFAPSEAVAVAEALEARMADEARARQLAGLRQGQESPVPPNRRDGESGEVRDRLAAYVGMGRTKLGQARTIVEAARRDPARYGDLVGRMDDTGLVDPAFKELKRRAEEKVGQQAQQTISSQPGPDDPYPSLEQRAYVDIRVCSPEELLASLDHSVDAIVTERTPWPTSFRRCSASDPPPPTFYARMAELAKIALKPAGRLAVVARNADLAALMVAVTPHLPYLTTIPILTAYVDAPRARLFEWRPVVVFGTEWKWNWGSKITIRQAANDDSKGIADLIELLTKPHDLVADPFMGDSTGIVKIGRTMFHPVKEACLHLNRSFVGADQDGHFQDSGFRMRPDPDARLREMVEELRAAAPGQQYPITDEYGKVTDVLSEPSTYPAWMGTSKSHRTRQHADRIIRLVEMHLDGPLIAGTFADPIARSSQFGRRISLEDMALLEGVLDLASEPQDGADLAELLSEYDGTAEEPRADTAPGVGPEHTDIEV